MRSYPQLALATIVAVYLLILVGGVVRATGSGMGCPDWPKCFGRWVPPTTEAQLPANYQEIYASHGYGEDRFNAAKTWTEYVNRLIGVVIGLSIFATLVVSRRYWSLDRPIVWWSLAAFVLVGFQGWLGSVVVDQNLAAWLVTVHMLVALVIVGILIYAWARSRRGIWSGTMEPWPRSDRAFALALMLSTLQVAAGTQVREEIDRVAESGIARAAWIENLGWLLPFHRTYSLAVLAVCAWLVWQVWPRAAPRSPQRRLGAALVAVLAVEIAAGATMYYFAVPRVLQPIHLLLAAVAVGVQLTLWLAVRAGARSEGRVPPDRADDRRRGIAQSQHAIGG